MGTFLADHFFGLMSCANIVSIVIAVWMYLVPFGGVTEASRLVIQYDTRSKMEQFWMGRVLHPRVASLRDLDLKFFFEGRPGLVMWVAMNASFAVSQSEKFGSVGVELVCVMVFQGLFVLDYYLFEDAILTTKDILDERFGFMMVWGDLVFVPFFFSIQCHTLSLSRPLALPWPLLILAFSISALGLVLFRLVNGQKHAFMSEQRRREGGKGGRKELVLSTGYWGWSRHPNYAADILQTFGWSLFCGVSNGWGWLYLPYLVVVFVHRERRDDALCARKFGAEWERHRANVPWRIFRGIY